MELTNQQKKALDLNRHLIVVAGAGSGKTTLLVERFIHILLAQPDTTPASLLAITFTDKAAQEMKSRILNRLQQNFQHAKNPSEQKRIFEIIKSLGEAQISTIHSFCKKILTENAWAIQISPDFRIAGDSEIKILLNEVFWELFLEAEDTIGQGKNNILSALQHLNFSEIKDILFSGYEKRILIQSFLNKLAKSDPDSIVQSWRKLYENYHLRLFEEVFVNKQIHIYLQKLVEGLAATQTKASRDFIYIAEKFLSQISLNNPPSEIIQTFMSLFNSMYTQKGQLRKRLVQAIEKAGEKSAHIFHLLDAIFNPLFSRMIVADSRPREEKELAQFTIGISQLLLTFFERVEQKKKLYNTLGFDDLLFYTLQLLETHPDLCQKYQQKYRWILIDEFQDTDTLQAQIILKLVRNIHDSKQNNLFIVGDPKQSIYGFRNADVSIFFDFIKKIAQQVNSLFPFQDPSNGKEIDATPEEKRGQIALPHNFRSTPTLIHFYNHLFQRIMQPESSYDVHYLGLTAARQLPPFENNPIQFILLEANRELSANDILPVEIETIAATINELVNNSKFSLPVEESGNSDTRPIQFKDIAILLRGREKLEALVQGLRKRNIPFRVHQGIGFYQTEEIQDIYYLLQAIYNPADTYAVVGALRSPFVGLSDIGLFYLSQVRGENYLQKIQLLLDSSSKPLDHIFLKPFADFLEKNSKHSLFSDQDWQAVRLVGAHFPRWHLIAQKSNFTHIMMEVLDQLQIPALLKEMEFGDQKLANLDKLVQFAYSFEKTHSRKISDFLQHFNRLINGEIKEGEAPLYSEDENQVQILTTHAAKGLEFPVVILPFLENQFNFKEKIYSDKNYGILFPYKFNDSKITTRIQLLFQRLNKLKKLAEEKRLLYVAMTRARDYLYLIGTQGYDRQPQHSALNLILQALGMSNTDRFQLNPPFIHESGVRIISRNITEKQEKSINLLAQTTHKNSDLPHSGEVDKDILENALRYTRSVSPSVENWEYSPTQIMIYLENPQHYIYRYHFKNGTIYPPQISEDYEDQPSGRWWGTLVHKMLENFHQRPRELDRNYIQQIFKAMKIPVQERSALQEALLKLISQFRGTALAKWLEQSPHRSEVRIRLPLSGGTLTGVLDKIFKNPQGKWEVVDFKTNRMKVSDIELFSKKYLPQVESYALLLQHLFPDQEQYPVTLYYLSVMRPKKFVFNPKQLLEIQAKIENVITQIRDLDSRFYFSKL